jgi:hypothetical protein
LERIFILKIPNFQPVPAFNLPDKGKKQAYLRLSNNISSGEPKRREAKQDMWQKKRQT